jgi:predicted protein tyrosine phosphatase
MLTLPITEITKIKVEPGDVVVVKSAKFMQQKHADTLKQRIGDLLPGAKVIVLDPDVSISVMQPPAGDPPEKPAGRRATSKKTAQP